MSLSILYRLDPRLICLVLMGVLVVASEIGYWVKKQGMKDAPGSIEKADTALIIGAVLTLLALLLGFTFAMSEGRFETRRQLVIEEANSIGTTYLRAKTLPEPRSSEMQKLLRQYTALRVEIAGGDADDPEKLRGMDDRTKELHNLLWSHAATLARESPSPVTALFLQTLNEMIDLHTKRLAAFRSHVPFSIYQVLFVISTIVLWLAGYHFGSHRPRARILTTLLAFIVVAVMWLIMDLDQPSRGAIRTSQQSLLDLHQDLRQETGDTIKQPH
jgi:hypothetical protein